MGCVRHGGVRLLVARAIAVPDRDECRHQKRLAGLGSVGALKAPTWTMTRRGRKPLAQADRATRSSGRHDRALTVCFPGKFASWPALRVAAVQAAYVLM